MEIPIESLEHHQAVSKNWANPKSRLDQILRVTLPDWALPMGWPFQRKKIVEFGPGIGLRMASLAALGCDVQGIEKEKRVVRMALTGIRSKIVTGDLLDLTVCESMSRQARVVITEDVLEHLPKEPLAKVLSCFRDMDLPMMIHAITYCDTPSYSKDPSHKTGMTETEWTAFFIENGWERFQSSRKTRRAMLYLRQR